jgi:phosphoglycerate dehydrogenase-like enzyme
VFRLPGERARSSPLAFGDVTFAVAVLDDYQDVARSFGPWDDLDADAAVARAFEMPVLAWSQNLVADEARALDVEPVGRDELLERADIVTIHLRLSDRTRGLIGAAELALMKRSTVLVNTSRGPIVDEPALIAALRDGTIAGAGLDVYDSEPLPRDHPLRSVPNTVLTPHLGYVTAGTYARYYADAVEDVAAFQRGDPIRVLGG